MAPTVGLGGTAVVTHRGGSKVAFHDVGGGKEFRRLWGGLYRRVHGLIFVVDGSDPARFLEARDELREVARARAAIGKPLLFVVNKHDVGGSLRRAVTAVGADELLPLNRHREVLCSAVDRTDEATKQFLRGLDWLIGVMGAGLPILAPRVASDMARGEQDEDESGADEDEGRADEAQGVAVSVIVTPRS